MSTEGTASFEEAPRTGRRRMLALDAARGLAVIGMIAVNTGPRGDNELLELIYRVPYGRASLLFVLLGGIGVSLMTRRYREQHASLPWTSLLWRCALLLLGGLALQELAHDVSVILQIYALLILFSIPLLRASNRILLLTMGISALIGPLIWIAVQSQTDGRFDREPVSASGSPWEVFTGIALTGPYPLIVWVAPFIFGIWLGRIDVTNPRISTRMIISGAIAATGSLMASLLLVANFGEPTNHLDWQRLFSAVAHSQMPLWLIGGTGSAVFVLGVCLKVRIWSHPVASPLVFLGQLALTAYVGHLLILAFIVRPGPDTLLQGVLATASTVAALMILAWLWRQRFSRGPFEVLLRAPKMRRTTR